MLTASLSIFIDSGAAIAKRVNSLLKEAKVRSKNQINSQVFCTKPLVKKDSLLQLIHSLGFEKLSLLDINSEILSDSDKKIIN